MNKKEKQERMCKKIKFLKILLPQQLDWIKHYIRKGQMIDAHEVLKQVLEEYYETFPFKYGSEMDEKGYSDEKVITE